MHETNYNTIASFEKRNWWYRAKRDLFLTILKRKKKTFTRALDLGCGVGSNYEVLSRFSKAVVGIDAYPTAIAYAKSRPYSELHTMDATRMKFKDNSFDLILCSDVLEHIDDAKAIKEITRVLRPGGLFIFSVPAHKYLWGPTDVISKHRKRYEKKDFKALLGNHYDLQKLSYWNTLMFLPDLGFILLKRIFGGADEEKNALEFIPPFLDNLIYVLLKIENQWFIRFNNPQGVSVVGVAQKRAE